MKTSEKIDALISSVLEEDILRFKKKHARLFQIVKQFLQNEKYMLYGGMAINYVLPKEDRFYEIGDIPDYDVFCTNAQKSAFTLTQILYDAGYKYTEAKPAMHYGTYKVYSNFIPVVDFTEVSRTMFNHLFSDSIYSKDIKMWCAPVHYLRMSMYLELSRPKGDISRWSKVYERLRLINKAFPITERKQLYTNCNKPISYKVSAHKTQTYNDSIIPLLKKILHRCIKHKYVFIGNTCMNILSRARYNSNKLNMGNENIIINAELQNIHINPKITYIDVLVNGNLRKNVLSMKDFIEKNSKHVVRLQHHNSILRGEFLPERYTLYIKNKAIMCMYSTFACHGYYTLKGKGMRIASIHTLLNIYFAALLTKNNKHMHCHLFNMIQNVIDIEKRNKYPIVYLGKCYGYQKTIYDMKKSYALRREKKKKIVKMKNFKPRLKNSYSYRTPRSKIDTKTTKGFIQMMKNLDPFSKLL